MVAPYPRIGTTKDETGGTMNILVLCTGNSARSILLESILNKDGNGRITAYSAGSKPVGRVHPTAVSVLDARGYPTDALSSKSWDVFAESGAPEMDAVITVCGSAAAEPCPVWPGAPVRAHWGVEDPAAARSDRQQAAFEEAFALLKGRAQAMLKFPIETMEGPKLRDLLNRLAD